MTEQHFFQKPVACIIESGKPKYEELAEMFLAGWGGSNGGVILREPDKLPSEDYSACFIGLRPSNAVLLHQCRDTLRNFITLDNGYWKPYKDGGFFRVTVNGMQAKGSVEPPSAAQEARFAGLGVEIEPWRTEALYVLVVLQSEQWYPMILGISREDWLQNVLYRIKSQTNLDIRVRDKPTKKAGGEPLETSLFGAACVVSLSSAVLLHAAAAGVPVFPMGEHPTRAIGGDLSRLNQPVYSEHREALFANLAGDQWCYEELKDGTCWQALSRRPLPGFRNLA